MKPIRILLADDHTVMRRGLRLLLEGQPGFSVVAEASDGREAVQQAEATQPDVAVVDIAMPNLSGIEAAERQGRIDRAVRRHEVADDQRQQPRRQAPPAIAAEAQRERQQHRRRRDPGRPCRFGRQQAVRRQAPRSSAQAVASIASTAAAPASTPRPRPANHSSQPAAANSARPSSTAKISRWCAALPSTGTAASASRTPGQ